MNKGVFVLAGAVFGFLLARARATDYAAIQGMFLLTDLHLVGVIGVAIATAAAGIALLKARGLAAGFARKPYHRAVLAGGIVFGVGWGLSGTCPGTALAQLGEGKLYALATIAGITLGTWIRVRRSGTQAAVRAAPRAG